MKKLFNTITSIEVVVGAAIVLPILFWMLFLNHVSINQVGVSYNSFTGEVTIQKHPGWYVTTPNISVMRISTLPFKVDLMSSATTINQKIIRFNPDGIDEYIHLQGFSSLHMMQETLKGYAFSNKKYSFLEVLEDSQSEKK